MILRITTSYILYGLWKNIERNSATWTASDKVAKCGCFDAKCECFDTRLDINPANIFLDEEGYLVLVDLGLTKNIAAFEGLLKAAKIRCFNFLFDWTRSYAWRGRFPLLWVGGHLPLGTRGIAGTFWYTAPEVFRYERYSFGVNYWSVGLIYYHQLITDELESLLFCITSLRWLSRFYKILFNHCRPYPQDKRLVIDFRSKPGQLKDCPSPFSHSTASLPRRNGVDVGRGSARLTRVLSIFWKCLSTA